MYRNTAKNSCQSICHHSLVRKIFSSIFSIVLIVGMLLPNAQGPVYAAAPPAPALLYPDDMVTVTAADEGNVSAPPQAMPVFSWDRVPNATLYRIQFSTDPMFAGTPLSYPTPLTQYTPLSINSFSDGTWYWRVRVEQPAAYASDYSPARSFTKSWASPNNAPQLSAPEDGFTLEFYDLPVFKWTPVIGAASYRFQVSLDPNFPTSTLSVNQETLTTSYQPTDFLQNGLVYYWRVVPLDPANHVGTASTYRSFTMGYNQVPVLIEPKNTSEPTFTPTFRWTAVRGAQSYQLQYSTDKTFNTATTNVPTPNTTYTPTSPLPNDKNYYWRVRAYNGKSYTDWSNQNAALPWYFIKRWYIKPVLLTPIATFQYIRFPFFSWTPVPGAASYKIEVDTDPSFASPDINTTTENPFYTPNQYNGLLGLRYWRVTPLDSVGNLGSPSLVSQFTSFGGNNSPDLVSPLYYYTPNTFPAPDEAVEMQPHEDRSIAYPLFSWQRLFDATTGAIVAGAYRLDVGTFMNPNGTVGDIVWTIDTENLSAAPKGSEFTPEPGMQYYWQVTPLTKIGGDKVGQFSQTWVTRFDSAKALSPTVTSTGAPQLLRPAYKATYNPVADPGYDSPEFVEITPALEWFPVSGASKYEVQISRSENFSALVENPVEVQQPVYVPRTSFGQRSLGHLGFGSYYWKVRAYVGSTWTGWSDAWRFEIAAQSQWLASRTVANAANRLEIARDTGTGDAPVDYDLKGLYASQDKDYWYFGFDYSGTGDSTYVIYLDMNNRNNSGASFDKRGYTLVSNTAHQPEYAIYIDRTSGSFSADNVLLYAWSGSAWDTGRTLFYAGGSLNSDGNYLEIKVPYQTIGMQLETGTYSLALASVDPASLTVKDVVPENPIVSGTVTLNNIATVSEHLSLSTPASDLGGDPTTFPSFPPFFWNAPAGSPWAGFAIEFYLDAQFSKKVGTFTITSTGAYYAPATTVWSNDIGGDNTYYWRVRPRYLSGSVESWGSWSQAFRFERQGFVPVNLQESVTSATPTFSWDRVEGASTYKLVVDTDPNFGSPDVSVSTSENTFTPTAALSNGTYNWKVEVIRKNNEIAAWSPIRTFTLKLPAPTGLTPHDTTVSGTPTFCWDVLSVSVAGVPVLYPYRYRVLISKGDPTFSSIYEDVTTTQNCYTPIKGYALDGHYYWKVAMYDGQSHMSGYSEPVATFQKTYPIAVPKSPVSGSRSTATPVFTWTAADGVTPYVFGAASYKIEVSLVDTFLTTVESQTTHLTTFTPTKIYASGKLYYWRIAMIDKNGNVGPFTNATLYFNPYKMNLPMVKK